MERASSFYHKSTVSPLILSLFVVITSTEYVSPSVMLPPGRMGALLDQAITAQHEKCLYHNPSTHSAPSLLEDHTCKRNIIPSQKTKCLPTQSDEVWCLEFSHNGNFLASGSKDSCISIWNCNPNEKEKVCHIIGRKRLKPDSQQIGTIVKTFSLEHGEGLHKLCWSVNDKSILGCTANQVILCFVETGEIINVLDANPQTKRIQSV